SGEHAAVVTILADSFLEDLGSTNGTLVNGKAIVKHFLTDHDQIDIGRQRLTYASDNDARIAALPADVLRNHLRGLSERVAPARPLPTAAADRSQVGDRSTPLLADLEREGAASPAALAKPPPQAARGPSTKTKARPRSTVAYGRVPGVPQSRKDEVAHAVPTDAAPASSPVASVPSVPSSPTRPPPS